MGGRLDVPTSRRDGIRGLFALGDRRLLRGKRQHRFRQGRRNRADPDHGGDRAGARLDQVQAVADGGRCTWFLTPANPVTARKRWIAGSLEPRGTLTIDAGAVAALRAGKSLLPAGVIRVDGQFARGDAVIVRGPDTHEIGRGLVAYDAENAELIKGRSSSDAAQILGISGRAEMIHRDDLVIGTIPTA